MIYLDSCIVIYLVERRSHWVHAIEFAIAAEPSPEFVISPVVKSECLVLPLREKNSVLEAAFLRAFDRMTTLDMPETVYIAAARLRAAHNIKLPDALHAACAQHHGCKQLWTNDDRLHGLGGFVRAIAP